jgi:hypothetical protein
MVSILLTIGPMLDGANLTAIRGHLQSAISTRRGSAQGIDVAVARSESS